MGSRAPLKPRSDRIGTWLTILLCLLLVADLSHAFTRYYTTPLDGDMPSGILVTWDVQKILDDPFGLNVVRTGHGHANPNRFFCHWAFANYFQKVPLLLQYFVDPVRSVYLACALAKLFIHIGLVLLLAAFVRARTGGGWRDLLLLAVLVTPLFQMDHYRPAIAIIDQSITYTFFYALPALGLLGLMWCFHRLLYAPPQDRIRRALLTLLILALCIILPLSGPLVAPSVLLGVLVLFLRHLHLHGWNVPPGIPGPKRWVFGMLLFLVVVCSYSLWLGTYNVIGTEHTPTINELYSRMAIGLREIFTGTLAIPILLAIILVNAIILQVIRYPGMTGLRYDMLWFLLFMILYLALLPLGGYRPWREYLVRFDTMIPFTLGLFYFYLATTWHVIRSPIKWKWPYGVALAAALIHFSLVDLHVLFSNACEVRSMRAMAVSPENIVVLQDHCHLMSWDVITEPEASALQGELLYRWKILEEPKLFYFSQE